MPLVSGNTSVPDDNPVLPPNMLLRGRTYYTRLQLNGRDVWRSTGCSDLPSAIIKAEAIRTTLRTTHDWKVQNRVPTFATWGVRYVGVFASPAHYNPTIINRFANHLGWGRRPLDRFRPSDCQDYMRFLAKHTDSKARLNLEHTVLKACFARAVDDDVIPKNPWDKVEGIRRKQLKPRMRLLSHEDEPLLLAKLKPHQARWATFMLHTGLRVEECSMLDEDYFDIPAKLLRLPGEITKGDIPREVVLFPKALEALEAQLLTGSLWPTIPSGVRKWLKGAARRAGVPHLSPHDLRHTFATRFLQGGGNIYHLSKLMGHASVVETERTYAHLVPADLVHLTRHVEWAATGAATAKAPVNRRTR